MTKWARQQWLTVNHLPVHQHILTVGNAASTTEGNMTKAPHTDATSYVSNILKGSTSKVNLFASSTPDSKLSGAMFGTTGNSAAHQNQQPFQVMNFHICTAGVAPTFLR